jgi:hypothetical protein
MTARCGSNDVNHRAKGCRACDRLYKRRAKSGAPPFSMRVRANPATCAICGIVAGNSRDLPVYRYPLKRWVKGRENTWIGSVGLCDACLLDHAEVKPQFRRAA